VNYKYVYHISRLFAIPNFNFSFDLSAAIQIFANKTLHL